MDAKDKPIVEVRGITKSFKIPLEGSNGVKQKLINQFRGRRGYRIFSPLNNISFTVNEGDFFGIVGKNGSGKSTLLKTLAGIYTQETGIVKIKGSLVPFIELGVGFNPELTGRENIYLNGALLGFSRKEISAMYEDIVDFAELHDFMEERLKNYSSGMQVRLAFSIAIKAKGDILLLDEVLAVGDAAFQQKCFDYFELLKKEKKTIIIVTHDMDAVKRFCNRAMIIKDGKIEKIGTPGDIANIYTEENIEKSEEHGNMSSKMEVYTPRKTKYGQEDLVEISMKCHDLEEDSFISISFIYKGFVVANINSKYNPTGSQICNDKRLTFAQELSGFNSGKYDVYVSLHRRKDDRLIEHKARAFSFVVIGDDGSRGGPMRINGEWRLDD